MAATLLDNIAVEQNKKYTENYATANKSTNSALVDLFAQAGSLRSRFEDIPLMFIKAFNENRLLATKLAFYLRDIRGGLGERQAARIIFRTLAEYEPEIMKKNLIHITEYGRYDDLMCLLDTSLKDDVISIIKERLTIDLKNMSEGKEVSLLAKWLPSINTSSVQTRAQAKAIIEALDMSMKEYRKTLSALRAYLNVTEVRLSAKDYDYIKYEQVPSNAMMKYRSAFMKNDGERFKAYLDSLEKGETTINASTLFPYDIVEKYLYSGDELTNDAVLEQQWKSLPDYVEGNNNFLIMADVSGSMYGRPMATSVGLAIYFAERNKGPFANKFMTFSSQPELVEIKGTTLREKVFNVMNADWMMNTDIEAAFELVLDTAIKYGSPKEEFPDSIVIISDMEIDRCTNSQDWLFYDNMKKRFEQAGYDIPNIVFWNVNARNNTFHASLENKGVQLASGQSPSVFKTLIEGIYLSPYEYVVQVLSDERYDCITI